MRSCILAFVLLTVSLDVAGAQSVSRTDRHDWITSGTQTDNTPRMVPMAPRKGGTILVLKGGIIFDTQSLATRTADIVIQDDRIIKIVTNGTSDWPAQAQVVDVTGKFVMPGLIDMHVHLTYPDSNTPIDIQADDADGALRGARNLRWFIESGFTSVRDLNGVGEAPYRLADASASNAIVAPRIFTAGHIITGTGGHATERPISPTHGSAYAWQRDGADAWRTAVRETFRKGASVIKIASHFAPDEAKAAIDEAHRLGLKVTCDCETIYTQMAADAGIDMIEHPLPRSDEAIASMRKHGVASVPTLQVYENVINRAGGFWGSTSRRFTMTSDSNFDMFRKMKAAGIVMGVGTDTIGSANNNTPNIYIEELKWFIKGGYSLPQTLQAATLTNARLLGMDDQLGSLEPGKLADIIVIDGRPDKDVDDLRKVTLVFKGGQLVAKDGSVMTPAHPARPIARLEGTGSMRPE